MLLFLCFYFFAVEQTHKIKAETSSVEEEVLLDKSKWRVTLDRETDYLYSESYDLTTKTINFDLVKGYIFRDSATDIINLWIRDHSVKDYYDPGSGMWTTRVIKAKLTQTVPLKAGRYYQFKANYNLSYMTDRPHSDHHVANMEVSGVAWQNFSMPANGLEKAEGTINPVFSIKAPTTKDYVFQQTFTGPYDGTGGYPYTDAFWKISNITYKDATNEWLTLKKRINGLFADTEQKELSLSTTTQLINDLRKEVQDFSNVLTATDKKDLENLLSKAQTLLGKINVTITTGELVDNPTQQESYTVTGKTYPKAFLSFSGSASLPEGQLSSEVKDDTSKYQIRANADGTFNYTLPKDQYFTAGETVVIKGMLNGKAATVTRIVKDTTPPEMPKLDPITDTSSSFSGSTEPDAAIKLYETGSTDVFLTGKADETGRFELLIPDEKKPLVPYKNYEVTAADSAGNISVASNSQQVKDTTPPSAEALIQYVKIGSAIPSISNMLKNIYDNAGVESVTKTLIKEPDLTKVGRTTAIVELMDKAQNKTNIEIPFLVESLDTLKDDTYMLYGENFSALAIDYPETEKEQLDFILANSNANAWELATAKETKELISIDKTSVKKDVGTYELSISIGKITKKITMTLLPGTLSIKNYSSDLSFGEVTIQSKRQNIVQQKTIELNVEDTRFVKKNWRLTAQLAELFQNEKGEKESGILLYLNDHGRATIPINTQASSEVFDAKDSNKREVNVVFSDVSRSLNLEIMPGRLRKDTAYTTKINWTLENGP
ncbi:hypothetical protein RV12_GL000541 [Enterococcus quebecensis]|nr:hypothetical protein RV12_GL000541 [Enterococcus quebecensis]